MPGLQGCKPVAGGPRTLPYLRWRTVALQQVAGHLQVSGRQGTGRRGRQGRAGAKLFLAKLFIGMAMIHDHFMMLMA